MSSVHSQAIFNSYGFSGVTYIRRCQTELSAKGYGIGFNERFRQFTLLNSKGMTKEAVQAFFQYKQLEQWYFAATDHVDPLGNRVISLQSPIKPYIVLAAPNPFGGTPFRVHIDAKQNE